MYRDELSTLAVGAVGDEAAHCGVFTACFKGGKGTTTGWGMALMTTSDGPGRSKGCKGRKSSPLPRGPCTACAARRMVGMTFLVLYR